MLDRTSGAVCATAMVLGALLLGGGAAPAFATPEGPPAAGEGRLLPGTPLGNEEGAPEADDPGQTPGAGVDADADAGGENGAADSENAAPTQPDGDAAGVPLATLADADFVVTTGADAGPGSLRAAVTAANAEGGEHDITFASALTVTLDRPLAITSALSILGLGQDQTVITTSCGPGSGDTLLSLQLPPTTPHPTVAARDLTLRGGDCELSGLSNQTDAVGVDLARVTAEWFTGAAIELLGLSGAVTLSRVTVRENSHNHGSSEAAAHLDGSGSFSVTDSRFVDNGLPGLLIDGWHEFTEGGVTVARNVFADTVVPDRTYVGSCLTVDLRVPVVLEKTAATVADNLLDTCVNSEIGGFQFVSRITDTPEPATGAPALEMTGNTLVNITGIPEIDETHGNRVDAIDFTIAGDHRSVVRNNTVDARHREIQPPHPEEGGPEVAGVVFAVTPVEVSHNTFLGSTVLFETPWLSGEDIFLPTVFENNVVDAGEHAIRKYHQLDPKLTEMNNVVSSIAPFNDPEQTRVATSAEIALGALADHGGLTPTILPQAGSVLIDAGADSALSPVADQRGVARPWGNAPDIGSTEVRGSQVTLSAEVTVTEGETATFTVSRSGNAEIGARASVRTADGSAIAGTDYRGRELLLEWAAGDREPKTVAVETIADDPVRSTRSFTVELLTPATGTTLGNPASSRGHIVDTGVTPPGGDGPSPGADRPGGPLPGLGGSASGPALWVGAFLLLGGAAALLSRRLARR